MHIALIPLAFHLFTFCADVDSPWGRLPIDMLKILQKQLFVDHNNRQGPLNQIAVANRIALTCKKMHVDLSLQPLADNTKNISLMALFKCDVVSILTVSQEKRLTTRNALQKYGVHSFPVLTISTMILILDEYKKMSFAGSNLSKSTCLKATIINFSEQCKKLPIGKISNLFIHAPQIISSYQTVVCDLIRDREYCAIQALISNGWPLITTEPLPLKMTLFPGITNGCPVSITSEHWGHHVGLLYERITQDPIVAEILDNSHWFVKTDTLGNTMRILSPKNRRKACIII